MYDEILDLVYHLNTPGFFITVICSEEAGQMPQGIEAFVLQKLQSIAQGASGRKFVFREAGWRLIFTFFPTNEVVNEKYALKNNVYKHP